MRVRRLLRDLNMLILRGKMDVDEARAILLTRVRAQRERQASQSKKYRSKAAMIKRQIEELKARSATA